MLLLRPLGDCISKLFSGICLKDRGVIGSNHRALMVLFFFSFFFFISFINVLKFAVYKFFTSLVKFIPKYFIIFDTIVNGIVFFFKFYLIYLFFIQKALINYLFYTY